MRQDAAKNSTQADDQVVSNAGTERKFLNKQELIAQTGLSGPTIERYKKAGRIPYFQPGGRGARVLFPIDAITAATAARAAAPLDVPQSPVIGEAKPAKRRGRRPAWECSTHP
jgi:hypothetical protein